MSPLHILAATGVPMCVGFTIISKLAAVPTQLSADGVTVMVEDIGALVPLVAKNAAMLPIPFDASPVFTLLFVQL